MKKIILVLANSDIGLYNFRKELIQELIDPGSFTGNKLNDSYEVYISLPNGERVQSLVNIGCKFVETPIDRRGINPITDLKLISFYYKCFKQLNPTKIITYTIKPNIYGSYVAKVLNIPYYVNITGLGTAFQTNNWIKRLVIFLYKKSLSKVSNVFFENVENRDVFVNLNIVNKNKTVLLNGAGVNLDDYPFTSYPDESNGIRFLFIGRVMKEKGINELLWAAKKIKEDYCEVQFDIVGGMEENYEDIINKYEKNGIINYYGFQKDVKPFIANCHCLVLPSYHEGMANTLLEAAAMGRPLITSDIHGCKEAINNNGYSFECMNKNDLYKALKQFILLEYSEKNKLAINSRKHIEIKFSKKNVVKATIEELEQ